MEITDSSAPSRILIRLDFIKPFKATNIAEFTLKPHIDATEVTWAMYGPSPYVTRLMTTFVSMEKLVGKSFEEGLGNLKRAAEK